MHPAPDLECGTLAVRTPSESGIAERGAVATERIPRWITGLRGADAVNYANRAPGEYTSRCKLSRENVTYK
jgi:hypothetical protein